MVYFLFQENIIMAQSGIKIHTIQYNNKIQKIDTLSIVPGSELVYIQDTLVSKLLYNINYPASNIVFYIPVDSFKIIYRTWPLLFNKKIFNKKIDTLPDDDLGLYTTFSYAENKNSNSDIFDFGSLSKNGSLSRGISIGNNSDVIMNSSMNLQLSGKLNNELNILAAISDDNIPIQPEGNTQQIQDFDKVYIQIFNDKTKLIAGDYVLNANKSKFLQLNKNVQGLSYSQMINPTSESNFRTTVSGAISKGKYTKNAIQGQEGNQGPYQLQGRNNERYIVIIAGSEKVYIDGKLKTRGETNDYTIDYNVAEIRFTTNCLITKNSRISIEFEYTDKNYVRTLLYNENTYQNKDLKAYIQLYSEQDNKNQPIDQELDFSDKKLLKQSGDSLHQAIILNADSVAFNNDKILYKMVDSIGYDSIFVYSTNPDSAFYDVGFAYIGTNKGNYIKENTAANGKVFKWIKPLNNIPQGDYIPYKILSAPEKKQMAVAGISYTPNKTTEINTEIAFSNNDINTFSKLNSNDNTDIALKSNIKKQWKVNKQDSLSPFFTTNAFIEQIGKNFKSPERIRTVEFSRDWNIESDNINETQTMIGFLGGYHRKNGYVNYNFDNFNIKNLYTGNKQELNAFFKNKKHILSNNISLLKANSALNNSTYIRQKIDYGLHIKNIIIGLAEEWENNKIYVSDTLQSNSFSYYYLKTYLKTNDSLKNNAGIFYKQRTDFLTGNNKLKKSSIANDINFNCAFLKNKNYKLLFKTTYRNLQVLDTMLTQQTPDNIILGKTDYKMNLAKGAIVWHTVYEIGSGTETKKEYAYIQVSPGQGTYVWNDYNNNNIKELDEFEIAPFKNEADYIRIYTPTKEYIRVYSNSLNQILRIDLKKASKSKFLKRISNTTAFQSSSKLYDNRLEKYSNPFYLNYKDTTISTGSFSFRNTLFFNRTNPVFGFDIGIRKIQNKSLLANGYDIYDKQYNTLNVRWNLDKKYTLKVSVENGHKNHHSEFFTQKNHELKYLSTEPIFTAMWNKTLRMSLLYNYKNTTNTIGNGETAIWHKAGIETRKTFGTKGSLLAQINYYTITYTGNMASNSIQFEMLNGLMPGQNATWELTYQYIIGKNLQLNLRYDGRKSEQTKAIHTGNMQLRAFF